MLVPYLSGVRESIDLSTLGGASLLRLVFVSSIAALDQRPCNCYTRSKQVTEEILEAAIQPSSIPVLIQTVVCLLSHVFGCRLAS